MRIDRIELFHVAMPLISPWRTAYGEDAAVHTVLCRLSSGSVEAWGESCPLAAPCYSPEWAGGVFAVARDWLGPALLGQEVDSGEALQQKLAVFKGNPFAKALFDSAWWALACRSRGVALHEALGGTRGAAAAGADFGVMDRVEDLVAAVEQAVEAGHRRVKLKFRPGWELNMLEPVRQAFPDLPIHIDCNGGYSLEDLPLFKQIDALNLSMIEQPLAHDDLLDHAVLQRQLATPLCLDESVKSVRHAEQAIASGSARFINIKPGRVGGLTPARAIHDLCRSAGIGCWVGGMLESALGASMCIALATLDHFNYPADLFPSSRFYHEDLCDPPIELIRLADGSRAAAVMDPLPEPTPQRLARQTVQRAVIGGSGR